MSAVLQPSTPPSVTLNTGLGFREYVIAMETILKKIEKIRDPDDPDPRAVANMMITEISRFFSELLPNIDLREMAAFFGAVIGTEIGGWVADGSLKKSQAMNEILAIVYASCCETVPRVVRLLNELREKQGQTPR